MTITEATQVQEAQAEINTIFSQMKPYESFHSMFLSMHLASRMGNKQEKSMLYRDLVFKYIIGIV